ncbi:hypothetical protein M758_12G075600 [Ceratodon purpureus]|nr:hypothetical protein M758_12G075600 [Ceratodon purpureus]
MADSCWSSALRCLLHRHGGQVQEHISSSEQDHGIGSDSSKEIVACGGNEAHEDSAKPCRIGGWKTTPYIFGNELGERLAGFGLSMNLITFLTLEMHMPTVKAANIITNFGGTCGLTPLVGAFIADAYLGRFKTIAITSVIYMLGVILLTLSATLSSLRPPQCNYHLAVSSLCEEPTTKQLWYFYSSLFLLAVGTGGIRPNTAAFGADQFNPLDPKEKNQLWHFFNWYYFSVGLSILGAVTVIVYVQDNVGWAWGFGIPAVAMALALVSFFIGAPIFRYIPPVGSPFTRLAQVIVASFRKRRLALPSDASLLHTRDDKGGVSSYPAVVELRHSNQFTFLDKAAIKEDDSASSHTSRWRLCTVHQVEELKSLMRMAPIWTTTILVSTVIVQQGTFSVQQARSMDRHMGTKFEIPAASFGVFGILMLLIWVPIYDLFVMRWLKKATGNERGITSLQRIGTGLFIAILAMVAAAIVEVKRRNAAHRYGLLDRPDLMIPVSAFWLVPQHCLFGLAESFVFIGELEFFYDQSPESMRSTGTALFWSTFAIGNYVSTVLVTLISKKTDWLENNLNRAHLDYFYWFLAVLSVVNLMCFLVSATWFRYRNEGVEPDPETAPESELANKP